MQYQQGPCSNRTQFCRRLSTLSTGGNKGVVRDHIGLAPLSVHLTEEVQGQLPPPCLLTGTDQAAVCDHIALTPSPNLHVRLPYVSKAEQAKSMHTFTQDNRWSTMLMRCTRLYSHAAAVQTNAGHRQSNGRTGSVKHSKQTMNHPG